MYRIRKTIIGALLWALWGLLLTGCSSVRLAYNNGPQLAWWWLDGYVDFSRDQTPVARQAIDRFFDWHRSTQLAGYLPWLGDAQVLALQPTTAADVCRYQQQVRDQLEPSLQRALAAAAELLPGLGEPQFKSIETRFAKGNEEMRDDFMQADPARRQAESAKRALKRAEMVYGSLGAAQKSVINDGVAASPFNPDAWLQDRQRRQVEVLQTLRRLAADKAGSEQSLASLRVLAAHAERSPDTDYRAYQLRLGEYNCAFAARLHNATTAAQRQRARDTFKGWQEDVRALIANG